jgi:hypothetical protein
MSSMDPAAYGYMASVSSPVTLVVPCRDGIRAGVSHQKDATTNILGHYEDLGDRENRLQDSR